MTLTYWFGRDDDQEFEFEPDYYQIKEFLESQDEAVLAEAAEEAFDKLSEQQQSEIITDLINDGSYNLLKKTQVGTNVKWSINWQEMVKKDKDWVITEFVFDNLDQFEDDMKDYFHREASEQYDDAEAYRKDPYGYNGVSPRDFY